MGVQTDSSGLKMDLDIAKTRFAHLASSDQRSKTARFRDVFDSVDAAICAGVSLQTARDELANLGLDLNLNTFKVILRRLRKQRELVSSNHPESAAKMVRQDPGWTQFCHPRLRLSRHRNPRSSPRKSPCKSLPLFPIDSKNQSGCPKIGEPASRLRGWINY